MKINNAQLLEEVLRVNQSFLILTHQNPDGDALGSALSFGLLLKKKKKKVDIFVQTPISKPLNLIFNEEFFTLEKDLLNDYDCVVLLDCSNMNYSYKNKLLNRGKKIINIDHHATNDFFGDINIVDITAASCTEVVYEILNSHFTGMLDVEISKYLYIGIVSDTGNFAYSNTTKRTHEISANLVSNGIDIGTINDILKTRDISYLSLIKKSINNFFSFNDNQILGFLLEDLDESSNTEGIIDLIRYIDGCKIAVLVKKNNNSYKVSLRSMDDKIDVAKIAASYNGGGHKKAAGFNCEKSKEELLKEIEKFI